MAEVAYRFSIDSHAPKIFTQDIVTLAQVSGSRSTAMETGSALSIV